MAFTKLITFVLKRSIGRARPYLDEGPRRFEAMDFGGSRDYRSMPSGHSSSAFALVSVFAARYPSPWFSIPLYGFGACVAVQRMDSRSHWLSDVVVGGTLGTLVGRSLVHRHQSRTESHVLLLPSIQGGRAGAVAVVPL